MSRNSGVTRSGDLDSLPSCISNHLGEGSSLMTEEVNLSLASPMEGSPPLETNPLAAIHPSVEEKTNIMTLKALDALREAYSFPFGVWVRLLEEGETITSARPSEVAFYEAAFPAGESHLNGKAPSSSGDVFESQNSHEHSRQQSPSQDDSVECLGSIRIELMRILPHIPDLTLLRWSGGKVFDPIFNRNPSSGSNPTSESYLDSSQPVKLDLNPMSKRISFKKLGEKLEKSKNGSSSRSPAPAKGVVIGEKHTRENLASSASKNGKVNDGSKGKGVDREPKGKKKATSSSNAPTTPATASSHPGKGTSANHSAVLGPTAFILGSPSVVEKLLRGVIPPTDKEKVEKLTLDQTVMKLFHVIGQARVREQQENDELAKMKSAQDSLADKVESEGFDFCKMQLRRYPPDLAIDLEGTMVDQDLLAKQDKAAEEKEKEKVGENEGGEVTLATIESHGI
ncbi:hypothetical protein Acr_07g0009540 [Actinidia rufa]|uniref:Uncharacterized protein n=1 Tax=Actinidia rufa TaxID=165716 RepID=A0A7J0EYP7_9ERIC|nr:hypothetical protein Acr_07g0009540 [Actinidia rufa]